jgi:hypothetical protein
MDMGKALTELELEQRRNNVRKIAAQRRAAVYCKRGHNDWIWRKDGFRHCRICGKDRSWYWHRGLKMAPSK